MSRDLAPTEADRRQSSLDVLKVLMALMVVALHGSFLREYSEPLWWYSNKGLFRMAVPLFLIMNGYFFAVNGEGRQREWLGRIVLLYAIWMVLYAPLWVPEARSIAKLAVFVAFGWFHLWYLVGVIGAVICLMALQRLGVVPIIIAAAACFLVGVVLQYAAFEVADGSILARVLVWNPSHRNFLMFSFPFLVMGYLIQKLGLGSSLKRRVIVIAFLAGSLLLLVEVTLIHGFDHRRGDVDNLASLGILAPAAFLLALKFPIERRWGKQASLLANGIYFTHPLFLVGLRWGASLPPTLATVATVIASATLTALIITIRPLSRRIL